MIGSLGNCKVWRSLEGNGLWDIKTGGKVTVFKYIKLAAATESVNYFACSPLHQTQHDGHKTKMGVFLS